MRLIVVDRETWQYRVGRSNVMFAAPGGKRFYRSFAEVTGWTWADIDRGKWKHYFAITPSMIVKFIRGSVR